VSADEITSRLTAHRKVLLDDGSCQVQRIDTALEHAGLLQTIFDALACAEQQYPVAIIVKTLYRLVQCRAGRPVDKGTSRRSIASTSFSIVDCSRRATSRAEPKLSGPST
jgi:hypothetical protein